MRCKRVCQQNRLRKKSSHGTSNCMCSYADGETVTNARLAICLVAFTLVLVVCGKADAQKVDAPSPASQQHILSLNFTNNGQHLVASVGQQIEITLGTVGGPQYGKPEVSSATIRLESVALGLPVTPGGPTFIYIFEAAAEGQAQVKVPIINSDNPDWTQQHTFAATIQVGPAAAIGPRAPRARPGQQCALDQRLDECAQPPAPDLHAIAAGADRGGSRTRTRQPGPGELRRSR